MRLTQESIEALVTNQSKAVVSQESAEVLVTFQPPTDLTQITLEVLRSSTKTQLIQQTLELLTRNGDPSIYIEGANVTVNLGVVSVAVTRSPSILASAAAINITEGVVESVIANSAGPQDVEFTLDSLEATITLGIVGRVVATITVVNCVNDEGKVFCLKCKNDLFYKAVNWKLVNKAYVAAITVCNQNL